MKALCSMFHNWISETFYGKYSTQSFLPAVKPVISSNQLQADAIITASTGNAVKVKKKEHCLTAGKKRQGKWVMSIKK